MGYTKKDIPTSYESADRMLGNRDTLRIGATGTLFREGTYEKRIVLRYHRTDIVTWYKDGAVYLDHKGYVTTSTQSWMNHALRGTGWYVSRAGGVMKMHKGEFVWNLPGWMPGIH